MSNWYCDNCGYCVEDADDQEMTELDESCPMCGQGIATAPRELQESRVYQDESGKWFFELVMTVYGEYPVTKAATSIEYETEAEAQAAMDECIEEHF
jgi:hypothetical protein